MSEISETRYVIVAGKECPICTSGGLFYAGDDEYESENVAYRCETCLTRFDVEKVPVWSTFIDDNHLDRERAERYFSRWMNKDRVDIIMQKLEQLRTFLETNERGRKK